MSGGFFVAKDVSSSEDESENEVPVEQKKIVEIEEPKIEDPEEKARQKRFEPYNKKAKVILEKIKISDYHTVYDKVIDVLADLEKNKRSIEKDGVPSLVIKWFVKLLLITSTYTSKDKNRLSKESLKAFSKLKQKIKKVCTEEFSAEIAEYEKHPIATEESEVEESGESESESESESEKASESKSQDAEASSEGSSDKWDVSDDENEDVNLEDVENMKREERRKLWLKTDDEPIKPDKNNTKASKNKQQDKGAQIINEKTFRLQETTYDFSDVDLTNESLGRRLSEIGKHMGDFTKEKAEYNLLLLNYLLEKIDSKKTRLEVMIVYSNLLTDHQRNQSIPPSRNLWLNNYKLVQEFLNILVLQNAWLQNGIIAHLKEENSFYERKDVENIFVSMLNDLNEVWNILIKLNEPESVNYAITLRDELDLLKLFRQSLDFFVDTKNNLHSSVISFKILEHIFYLSQESINEINKLDPNYCIKPRETDFIEQLASRIYKRSKDSNIKTKTALYQSFNYSQNNQFQKARDLLLMYNIPEKYGNADKSISFAYNRAIANLGLCAFRHGKTIDCQEILEDLCTTGKLKDHLNQTSIYGYSDGTERFNVHPYHMSMSVESIESVYLISVMINEVPTIVLNAQNNERKSGSKLFQKLLIIYEKNPLNGPPENHRDLIHSAVKELMKGEWRI